MSAPCFIAGLGLHLPRTAVSNSDLARIVDTSDEWIRTRTGISSRYFSRPDEPCSVLAWQAARKALENAGLAPHDLTHLMVSTCTPDSVMPATACLVLEMLGVRDIPAFDLSAACSGFLYGLETARAFTALYPDAVILVIGSEVMSSRVNFADRTTCVLFGDGAGAAVVTGAARPGRIRVLDVMLKADGSVGNLLTILGGGSACKPELGQTIGPDYFLQMTGRDVFKYAVRWMSEIATTLLERNNLSARDIDLVIPHQANSRIIEAIAKKLEIDMERMFLNVDRVGNTSAASVPIALAEAEGSGRIQPGAKVLLAAFGGGFTWGAGLLQF